MNDVAVLDRVRVALERAQLLLKERAPHDREARMLLHDVNNTLGIAQLLERADESMRTRDRLHRAVSKALVVHEHVREYAARNRIHYAASTTPVPAPRDTMPAPPPSFDEDDDPTLSDRRPASFVEMPYQWMAKS